MADDLDLEKRINGIGSIMIAIAAFIHEAKGGPSIFWTCMGAIFAIFAALTLSNSFFGWPPVIRKKKMAMPPPESIPVPEPPLPQPIENRGVDFSEVRTGNLDFPVKIVFTLCNVSHEKVYLQSPDWMIDMDRAQLQVDAGGNVGFKFNVDGMESLDATVQPGQIFNLWIGLSSNYDFAKLYDRRKAKTLGTLILSGHIVGGAKFEQRFQV